MAGLLNFRLTLEDLLGPKLSALAERVESFGRKVEKPHKVKVETQQAEGGLSKLMGLAGRAFAALGVFEAVKSVVKLGSDLEQTRVQFETFTGSAEKGNAVIERLQKFAQVTPFDDGQVISAGRQLLAFGDDASSVIPTLTKLGNIASGSGKDFNELVSIYGKNKLSGIIQSDDLNQLNDSGIPVIKSLAKQLGVAESGVRKMAEGGKISFGMLDKAFEELGGSGGKWGDLMDKQSKTVAGRWSSLVGFAQNLGGKLGEAINPFIGKIVDGGNALMTFVGENTANIKAMFAPLVVAFQPLIDAFATMTEQEYGAGDAGGILASVFNRVATVIQFLSPVIKIAVELLAKVWLATYKLVKAIEQFIATSPRLQKIFSGLWSAAVAVFKGIAEAAVKYFGGVTDLLEGVFTLNFDKVKSGFKQVLGTMGGGMDIAEKAGAAFGDGYKKGFKKSTLFNPSGKPAAGTDAATDFLAKGGKPGASALAPGLATAKDAGAAGANGGSKVTNITLRVQQLVGEVKIQAATVSEGADQMADIVLKKLMAQLNDVNTIASN